MSELQRIVTIIPAKPRAEQEAMKQKLQVAAYCRVSTDDEEQQSSYEAQCSYYTEKIMTNPEWTMAGIFADEGSLATAFLLSCWTPKAALSKCPVDCRNRSGFPSEKRVQQIECFGHAGVSGSAMLSDAPAFLFLPRHERKCCCCKTLASKNKLIADAKHIRNIWDFHRTPPVHIRLFRNMPAGMCEAVQCQHLHSAALLQ